MLRSPGCLICSATSTWEMSAVIVALDTPYYAISDAVSRVAIADVPAGRYTLHVWREGTSTAALKNLTRSIVVSGTSASFGTSVVPDNAPLPLTHKNKYRQDYVKP